MLPCCPQAIYYPFIGNILRYSGAVCGGIYVFALPVLVRRKALLKKGEYSWFAAVPTAFFMLFGVINVLFQFVQV